VTVINNNDPSKKICVGFRRKAGSSDGFSKVWMDIVGDIKVQCFFDFHMLQNIIISYRYHFVVSETKTVTTKVPEKWKMGENSNSAKPVISCDEVFLNFHVTLATGPLTPT
jgi:alkyl hydroperoxide reductase subunit AhpC